VVFLGAVIFAVFYQVTLDRREESYEELAEEVRTADSASVIPTEMPTDVPETVSMSQTVEIPIDFSVLQEKNPDIYAWILIPGTGVDYPILQSSTDQAYYLNHTAEGAEGYPGSIYTENLNKKDFTDKNTVIYGHNMKDDSMFGSLKKYVDSDYMKEHPQIIIYTPEHKLTYQIYAGITYDDRHILGSFDFTDTQQYQAYLNSIDSVRNMASYRNPEVEVTTEDKIITLSTCNSNQEQRFLVEAVLISEE
jgi:sortase B